MEPDTDPVEITPYDNDVTLLYKWGRQFEMPEQYIIVRPRTVRDVDIPSGTATKVFESLPMVVQRLHSQGETPEDMYQIIHEFNEFIDISDIIMTYYGILSSEDPDPDLYKQINQIYRSMDDKLTIDPFEDQTTLQLTYDAWISGLQTKMERDDRRLDAILDIQDVLEEIDQEEKIPISPPTINSTIVSFSPTIHGVPVTADDGLDLFNLAIPSKHVPYIRYNDQHGKPYFRVYTENRIERAPNYNVTVIPPGDTTNKNTIYMNLWLGDPNNGGSVELKDATRDSFFVVVYNLTNNHLTIESPIGADQKKGLIRDENIAFQRTKDALPMIDFGNGQEMKVRGDFNLWGMDLDETSFLDMVLLEPVMNVYLYVEENIKPFALKKRLDVHYRSIYTDEKEGKQEFREAYISNSASVSVTLSQKIAVEEKPIEILDPRTGQVEPSILESGTPYIHVNISQAESRKTIDNFLPIFQLLMKFYLENRQEVSDVYIGPDGFLPELTALEPLLAQRKQRPLPIETTILNITRKAPAARRVNAKISQLQELAPDVFVQGYARRCQCKLQPIIVSNEEAEQWKQRRVGPNMMERQVMPFPKDNPRWNFVCPDDRNPYPGVKINHDLPNRDKYGYIPCCFQKNQMAHGAKSKYRDYISGRQTDQRIGAKAEKKISTRKILLPNRVAFLPRAVENIVKRYSDDYIDMVRYGIIYSPNCLLHCVCVGIDDPEYLRLRTDEDKEAYVTRIRQHMLATIDPSLLKQELYDYTDQEITESLGDNSVFLDPALFYRAVEETFQINIYVFTPPLDVGDEADLGSLEVPRYKLFHAHSLRPDRPTIAVMKTWGSESDALDHPQCELIVDYDVDNLQIMKMFGPEMTDICHFALQESLRTITWDVIPNNTQPADTKFEARSNMYYYLDHQTLFPYPAVSQVIDRNGKMRALNLQLPDEIMTIVTVPSQPFNVPVTDKTYRISFDTVQQVFEEFTGVSETNGKMDGVWLQIMDLQFGEYVPIIPIEGPKDLIVGPSNPLETLGENVTSRLGKLRRTLNIIVQIVRWLYEIARNSMPTDPSTFVKTFMVADHNPVEDSSTYYDLSHISRRLPTVATVQQAIAELEPVAPSLFHQGKIVMYSPDFAQRMIKMLDDFSNLRHGMPLNDVDFIENYYETESDFRETPNTKIFIGLADLNAWLTSLKSSQNYSRYFKLRSKIEIAMGYSVDPYLYQDDDGKIYIIQNVVGVGAKSKAIAVAQIWDQYKVNIGSDPSPSELFPHHMVYGISPASKLVPIEDLTENTDTFLKIVYYGTYNDKSIGKEARYGAMLEIL